MNIFLIEIEWVLSPLWLIACVALGILAALHLYFRSKDFEEAQTWQRWTMAILRGVTIATLAALLLTPIIKLLSEKTERKNIVLLQDNSASLQAIHDSTDLIGFDADLQTMLSRLDEKVNTHTFYFDHAVSRDRTGNYDGKTSNLSNAIEQIKEQFEGDRLSGIILTTDGIYNEGQNPYYQSGLERTPLYTIALGDTSAGSDAEIQRVFHNRVVYKGDEFEIEADISASGLINKSTQVNLSTVDRGKTNRITSQPIRYDKSDFFKTVKFKTRATTPGVIRYRVSMPAVSGDGNTSNNYADFYVEVIESRQKILLLANSPHPDLNAMKLALEALKNYEVDIQYARNNFSNFREYDLVALHNLPSGKYSLSREMTEFERLKIPLLFIVGSKTDLRSFNRLQNVVSIQQSQSQFTDAEPAYNSNFNLFSVNNEIRQFSRNLPPLRTPFGSYSPSAGYDVLFKQEIKNVETNYPLIILGETNENKKGVITGEGIWKWRLYDYAQNQSFERSDELIAKAFQYLAITGDRRRFKISKDKTIYDENDRIFLNAEFYNASYELKNENDVSLTIKNENGEVSSFAFSKTDNSYGLDLGTMAPGEYRYTGEIQDGGQRYSASGRFTVRELIAELQHIRADHQLLRNMSSESNGAFYSMNDVKTLENDLINSNIIKPLYITDYDRTSVLNLKWLLILLLLTLSLEWFMRKFLGTY